MSIEYFVNPSSDMLDNNGRISWLDELGVRYNPSSVGRYPSLREIRQVLAGLGDGYTVEEDIESVFVCSKNEVDYASLDDLDCEGKDEVLQHTLRFSGGSPTLIVFIVEALSRICGDFVVISPDDIILVTPGTSSNAKWTALEHHGEPA